jgi:hypothetical protein
MAALLPDDILHIICDQLWEQRDFDTLYRCTCSGKQLAVPALASIYRYDSLQAIRTKLSDDLMQDARDGAHNQRS